MQSLVDFLFTPFADYAFMRRALVGCIALALGATPIGVFLMLRRMSLTGDAMACAILPGAAVGYLYAGLSLAAMTVGGFIAGVTVAFAAGLVAQTTLQREDASLAAFYLISLALGALIISKYGGSVDLMHVLFGGVLALNDAAILLIAGITTLTLVSLAFLYRALVLECMDSGFLGGVCRGGKFMQHAFMLLVVLNLVGGFHALGTLMCVGIMILPAAAARFCAQTLPAMCGVAVGVAMLSGVCGLLFSYHFNVASGPAIILSAGGCYLLALIGGKLGPIRQMVPARGHYEA